jgi:hypothetical protein
VIEEKNMRKVIASLCLVGSFGFSSAFATPASDALLAKYKAEGVSKTDADKGRKDWIKESKDAEGEVISCSTCHGKDLTKEGKHHKTRKVIDPMSPHVNKERFTDEKKVEKWFKRNCKDTWGRECTSQEKADFLTFLLTQ